MAAAELALTEPTSIALPGSIGPAAPALGGVSSYGSLYSYYGSPSHFTWVSGDVGFYTYWGSWSYDWGYYESDWGGGSGGEGQFGSDGYYGYAGPWSGWGSYYGGWGYAWGYGYHGWSAAYAGSAPTGVSANHSIDVDGELNGYRSTVAALKNGVLNVAASLTNLDEIAHAVINAATGAISIGLTTVLSADVAERVQDYIESRGYGDWSGKQVRVLLAAHAPEALEFFDQHFTLLRASNGADEATLTARLGEAGAVVDS